MYSLVRIKGIKKEKPRKSACFRGFLARHTGFEPVASRLGEPSDSVKLTVSKCQKHRNYMGFAIIRCQTLNIEKQLKSGLNRGVYWLPISSLPIARVLITSSNSIVEHQIRTYSVIPVAVTIILTNPVFSMDYPKIHRKDTKTPSLPRASFLFIKLPLLMMPAVVRRTLETLCSSQDS